MVFDPKTDAQHPLFVFVGGTGVGKGELMKRLFELFPELRHATSWTTRARRDGEAEDAYFFTNPETFEEMIRARRFYEWAEVHGRRYGRTAESFAPLAKNPALCDMTEHGVKTLEEVFGRDALGMVVIEIVGQNMSPLARRDERAEADGERAKIDISIHHVIVNDHAPGGLDRAVAEAAAIIQARIRACHAQKGAVGVS